MEQWKPIDWADGHYEVSDHGRVRSCADVIQRSGSTILKGHIDQKGYERIKVTVNGLSRTMKVHREVARAFVPNENNLPQVNHINGVKTDNRAENLEWITNKDNAHHAIQHGLWVRVFDGAQKANEAKKTPVIATNVRTGEEIRFASICEAQEALGTKHITNVLKGERMTANGYTFRREVIA